MKLYEIAEQHRQLLDLIKEGEIPEEAIADTLECVEGELNAKAESIICNCCAVIWDSVPVVKPAGCLRHAALSGRGNICLPGRIRNWTSL